MAYTSNLSRCLQANREKTNEDIFNLIDIPQLDKQELQKRVIAHNVKQFFISDLPICRICLETEDDSKGTATLNEITTELWNYMNFEENHFPKWICTKCERIIVDFMLLSKTICESGEFIRKIEQLIENKEEIMVNTVDENTLEYEKEIKTDENDDDDVVESASEVHLISKIDVEEYQKFEPDLMCDYQTSDLETYLRNAGSPRSEMTEYLEGASPAETYAVETIDTDDDEADDVDVENVTKYKEYDSAEMQEEYLEYDEIIEEHLNYTSTNNLANNPKTKTYILQNKLFKCMLCNKFSTTRKNHNMHHAISHTKPHPCPVQDCDKRFGLPALVRRHVQQVHSETSKKRARSKVDSTSKYESLKCIYCDQVFLERFKLNAHIKLIHDEATLPCTICGKQFNEVKMKAHMKVHEKMFQCDLCGQRYGNKYMIKKHINEKHLNVKDYLCTKCGQRFGTAQKLRRHILTEHNAGKRKPGVLPDELKGYCKYENCGLRFADKTELVNHSKEHSLIYKCKICCCRFASAVALAKHEVVHDNVDYPFECLHCRGRYKSKVALNKHMSKIHINRRWICSICNKTLASHRALVSHEKQHEGIKEFGCFYCSKNFASGRRLKDHLIAVHTESRYQCPSCTQRFVCSRGIISHLVRDHPGVFELQPDVSVYFDKDVPKYDIVLKKYKREMAKRNEERQGTGSNTKSIKLEVIDLGFLDRKEIDSNMLQFETM